MKTLILIGIVIIIAGIALKSLYKMFFKGESGCSCSKGDSGNCSLKDKCKH